MLATPGLTAVRERAAARSALLEDALRAAPLVAANPGPLVDVGSGGGTPGIPLAVAFPERPVTLLEAERKKCDFLRSVSAYLPNVEVVWGRAEEQPTERYGLATAKALAKPPVAVELCLPLVEQGGAVVLWVGATADLDAVVAAAEIVGGVLESAAEGLVVVRKTGPTPSRFPRRAGMAKKRPLA